MAALRNEVEIDETYIGGKEANKHESRKLNQGRRTLGKQAVLRIRERRGDAKAMVIDAQSQEELPPRMHEDIEHTPAIYMDEHRGYDGIDDLLYDHNRRYRSAKEIINKMAHDKAVKEILNGKCNGLYHHWFVRHCRVYVNDNSFRMSQADFKGDTNDPLDSPFRERIGKTITYKQLNRYRA